MLAWDERRDFLLAQAALDLEQTGEVTPCLLAFAADQAVLVAFCRPFAKGAYADPMIELLALVMPLDADRLALSLAGRAWSLHDPVPPVIPGVGDLRQRVVVVTEADGRRGRARVHSTITPFELAGGLVRWGEPTTDEGDSGWISGALRLAVERRHRLRAPLGEIRAQAERCARLGHRIALAPAVHDRLYAGTA